MVALFARQYQDGCVAAFESVSVLVPKTVLAMPATQLPAWRVLVAS